jgi:hypothetical protein
MFIYSQWLHFDRRTTPPNPEPNTFNSHPILSADAGQLLRVKDVTHTKFEQGAVGL